MATKDEKEKKMISVVSQYLLALLKNSHKFGELQQFLAINQLCHCFLAQPNNQP